jgi:hypothetical protein
MKIWISIVAVIGQVGCTDEADIGTSSEPIKCVSDQPFTDVSGSITDPSGNHTHYTFDTATARATNANGTSLRLIGDSLQLNFGFYCGAAERAKYGVKGDTQAGLDCPLEVASAIYGQIEYLPAQSGTLIVDENSNCFAGRFHVDFGSAGSIDGSFSTAWQ